MLKIRGTVLVEIEDRDVFEAMKSIIHRAKQDCWLETKPNGKTVVMTEEHTSHRFDIEVESASSDFIRLLDTAEKLSKALRDFQNALGKR